MIPEKELLEVIQRQKDRLLNRPTGMPRDSVIGMDSIGSHAIIISGVRRCGKSTFMLQMLNKVGGEEYLFINFESPLLYRFTKNDFTRLDRIIDQLSVKWLFFDEIQYVENWEIYIRQKLDEGYKVVVTGSNASLLSSELGSKLTGRHISAELFPFSYREFLDFKKLTAGTSSLTQYLHRGGFPEFLKTGDMLQLSTLFDDILLRDIVSRFGIKEVKSLQNLTAYLGANIGNRFTASKMKQTLSVSATSTILNWLAYLENSYLFSFVPMYSHSVRAMLINPRKVYCIDNGLLDAISLKASNDLGHKLENLVYLQLRRNYKEIYYFDSRNASECDFIVMSKGVVIRIIQVCFELNADNIDREIAGAMEAMRYFRQSRATMVTVSEKDEIQKDGLVIELIPAAQFLLENP